MSVALGLEVEPLARVAGVRHSFSTRLTDRARFLEHALGAGGATASRVVTLGQVHGASIFEVRDPSDGIEPPEGHDAAVTALPGVALGILTADCVPVLLADSEGSVVAAAHAGWRGTAAEIVVRVVQHLERVHGVRPEALRAAIGPCIGRCCFEVGEEVVEALASVCPGREAWTERAPGAKPHVDLAEANHRQLVSAGLAPEAIGRIVGCTRCDGARFTSYRREGAAAGRQLSVIALAPR